MHWADKCPCKNERSALIVEGSASEDKSAEKINIVLITKEIEKVEIFVVKASKSADTACTKTVAGEKWFEKSKSSVTEKAKQEIEIYSSNTSFKFGDRRKFKQYFA